MVFFILCLCPGFIAALIGIKKGLCVTCTDVCSVCWFSLQALKAAGANEEACAAIAGNVFLAGSIFKVCAGHNANLGARHFEEPRSR